MRCALAAPSGCPTTKPGADCNRSAAARVRRRRTTPRCRGGNRSSSGAAGSACRRRGSRSACPARRRRAAGSSPRGARSARCSAARSSASPAPGGFDALGGGGGGATWRRGLRRVRLRREVERHLDARAHRGAALGGGRELPTLDRGERGLVERFAARARDRRLGRRVLSLLDRDEEQHARLDALGLARRRIHGVDVLDDLRRRDAGRLLRARRRGDGERAREHDERRGDARARRRARTMSEGVGRMSTALARVHRLRVRLKRPVIPVMLPGCFAAPLPSPGSDRGRQPRVCKG